MKKITLLSLCCAAALMAACGGSQQSAGGPADQPGDAANMTFSGLSEAREYLESHYSEDQIRNMYIEFAALSQADIEHYYEKDESGIYVEHDEATEKEILEKMNDNINAVIKRFGINQPLYAALMMHVRDTDWPIELEDQIKSRAAEINAERPGEN